MSAPAFRRRFEVEAYDLAATLDSGQAFRWQPRDGRWEGVVAGHWIVLRQPAGAGGNVIEAECAADAGDWRWLRAYLQLDVSLDDVLATFPPDRPLKEAVRMCRGLRLLRQEPWECLASFLLSSTKQIVQIRRCVAALCERFGDRIAAPAGHEPVFDFPRAGELAAASEAELRACGIGFRAKYLHATARAVSAGRVCLDELGGLPLDEARERLMSLPGVGPKIADCVLLFAYGFARAFPVDVWILRALRELYFTGQSPTQRQLLDLSRTHFGAHAGFAQQYLFHAMRLKAGRVDSFRPRSPT